jgi:hypothetical protein
MNNVFGRISKEAVEAKLNIIFLHLPRGTEVNQKNKPQDN